MTAAGPVAPESAEPADSDVYPWAQDFDDVWHLRPPGQGWDVGREVDHGDEWTACATACGTRIPSVHASTYVPSDDEGDLCRACVATFARPSVKPEGVPTT